MKGILAIICLVLIEACSSKEDKCNIKSQIFPKVENELIANFASIRVFSLQEIWTISKEQDSMRCEDMDMLLSDYLKLDEIYIPITIDWPCDLPPDCELLRYRDAVNILINQHNQLLWKGEIVNIQAMDTLFESYYLNNGANPFRPKSPNRTRFYLEWSLGTDQVFVEQVLYKLTDAYTKVIRSEIGEVDNECSVYRAKRKQLISKYPFKLKLVYDEWDSDRIPPLPPPPEHINTLGDEEY